MSTWILCGKQAASRRARTLENAGCVIQRVAASRDGLSLPAILDLLGAAGMTNVLVEGGGQLLGRFVDQRLADEFHIYVAPLLLGGAGAVPALAGSGPRHVRQALKPPARPELRRLGDGWFIRAITDLRIP